MNGRLLLALLLMTATTSSHADIIEYEFTGEVINLPSGIFTPYYLAAANGVFSYDTSWESVGGAVASGSGERETYLASSQNWRFMLSVGDFTFASSPSNTSSFPQLTVQNNGTFSDPVFDLVWDEFSYYNDTNDNFIWQVVLGEYLTQPAVPYAFLSTDIPTDLMLDEFNSYFALIRGNGSELRVTLDSLAAVSVPEPGTLALFLIGLAGMGLATRKRAT